MFRYFMAPAGLIAIDELPDKWGLIEVDGRRAKVVAGKPPKKHPSAFPDFAHTQRNSWGERTIAHSLIRRMVLGEDITKYV